jgi:hypothetical protein
MIAPGVEFPLIVMMVMVITANIIGGLITS